MTPPPILNMILQCVIFSANRSKLCPVRCDKCFNNKEALGEKLKFVLNSSLMKQLKTGRQKSLF